MRNLILAALTFSSLAFAQTPGRDVREERRDQREANRDRNEVWKDWADIDRLAGLMQRFDMARARRDGDALALVDAELQQLVRSEIRGDSAKVKEEARDVRRDERDLRKDKAEVRGDVYDGRPGMARADERDARQDRRDVRDDKRHVEGEVDNLVRVRAIQQELNLLLNRYDNPSLDAKKRLMGELMELARREAGRNSREAGEDQRKVREERREVREDMRR
jgi:hypothetical protein